MPAELRPSIQHLATGHHDIVVGHPDGVTLYRQDGGVVPAKPELFTGVNSKWPGAFAGLGAGTGGLMLPALPSP